MKQPFPVQNVSDLCREVASNWKDFAVWLIDSGPNQAGGSATVARLVQENIKDRTLLAFFPLMACNLSAGWCML